MNDAGNKITSVPKSNTNIENAKILSKSKDALKRNDENSILKSNINEISEEAKDSSQDSKNVSECSKIDSTDIFKSANGSLNWTIKNVSAKMKEKQNFKSETFKIGLYKMQASITFCCLETFVLSVFLVKGDNDHFLQWPFLREVNFVLKEPRTDRGKKQISIAKPIPKTRSIDQKIETMSEFYDKPTNIGKIYAEFVDHVLKYVENDCLSVAIYVSHI